MTGEAIHLGPSMPTIPPGYEIGRPRAGELAQLPDIEREAAALFPPEDLPPPLRDDVFSLSFFEEVDSAGRLWVARTIEPAVPVGFAAVILLDGSPHLEEMDVLPSHGRRGLGRALVNHVVDWARASGFAGITLTTFRHLPFNAPFYASAGFAEMPATERGPELLTVLAEEEDDGLDPSSRVAMRLELRAGKR